MRKQKPSRLPSLYRLVGLQVTALLVASVPVGILIGIIEIVTATVLYAVLEKFHLVAASPASSSITLGLDPVAALLLFAVLTGFVRYLGQLLPAFANLEFHRRLRKVLVRSILGGVVERSVMPVAEASHLLMTVIPRSGDFLQSISGSAVGFCLFLIVLAGMLHMSLVLTAVALGFALLLGLTLVGIRKTYGKEIEKIYSLTRLFNTSFLKTARNSNFLRICGANEQEEGRLFKNANDYVRTNRRYYLGYAFGQNIPQVASVFVVVGMLWVNARMSLVSSEGLVPLVYLLARTAGSMGSFAVSMGQFQQNRPYFADLYKQYSTLFPPTAPVQGAKDTPAELLPLVLDGLSFGRTAPLIRPLSLTAGRGDVVVISGASGKGKTSLIMTLIGILNPLDGRISWGGVPVEMIDPMSLRQRLGYAGPEPYLIDADIRANLVFGMEREKISAAEIENALRLACAEFVFDLEGGCHHQLQEAGEGISAGQKQRLSLARCLLRSPDILLLDEATANIDEETEGRIIEQIKEAFPEMLIIAVSHRASLRRYATTIIEI